MCFWQVLTPVSVSLSIYTSVSFSVHPSAHPSISHPSIHPSIHTSTHPLPIHSSIWAFIYLFTNSKKIIESLPHVRGTSLDSSLILLFLKLHYTWLPPPARALSVLPLSFTLLHDTYLCQTHCKFHCGVYHVALSENGSPRRAGIFVGFAYCFIPSG